MDKKIIHDNFSKNAGSYDDHAVVQMRCAEKLVDFMDKKPVSRILEVGCGTGLYTRVLRDMYRHADITAIDISENMVNCAREKFPEKNVRFKIADGGQMVSDGKFDLITSNASLQWFEDLEETFQMFSRILADDGMLCFSMYGPGTFREFNEVVEGHFKRRFAGLSSRKFAGRTFIENVLRKYFTEFKITEEYFTVEFFSLWDFLRNIKYSGTRGEGLPRKIFLGKYMIKEMEKTYMEKFGSITATHHVYFCRIIGVRPPHG